MKTVLGFDTETTGLFDFNKPVTDPEQPHLVQLAAILAEEETGIELASISLVIRPAGWWISDEVAMLHGISQEMAEAVGIPQAFAVQTFLNLADRATTICAHSIEFDQKVIARDLDPQLYAPGWKAQIKDRGFCTMMAMNKIMKKGKWPKLSECYAYLFNEEISGAHNAMVDVRACLRVYHEIKRREKTDGAK